jgi:diketogulonate reductase-like aldo/keto reductase
LRTVTLPGGEIVPALGQGTWEIAERRADRAQEIAALRAGLDLGMTVIDTAEMYGNGRAEELAGEAIAGRRDEVFLVSKVLPQNASRSGTVAACEASLRRLKTDRIDLYLLHWRGSIGLRETLDGMRALSESGKIRHWGVSNFDVADMKDLLKATSDAPPATNQVLYNLTRRGIEYDLLPWQNTRSIPIMAYSPLEQGRLARNQALRGIASRLDASPSQLALAWVLRRSDVIAIPKASRAEHVRENRAALDLTLSPADLDQLDDAFPPPKRKTPLEMI